jgi:hypothetical protein
MKITYRTLPFFFIGNSAEIARTLFLRDRRLDLTFGTDRESGRAPKSVRVGTNTIHRSSH